LFEEQYRMLLLFIDATKPTAASALCWEAIETLHRAATDTLKSVA
jgi:hypothetical protein